MPPSASAWRRGEVDAGRTLRRKLRRMGEPAELALAPASAPGRVGSCCWSMSRGSMSPVRRHSAALAHRVCVRLAQPRSRTEVFTVGTRLTRVTRAMRLRDGEQRDRRRPAGPSPTGRGGTRLGEALQVFLDRWGQRGLARGAVVVIFSDGWERGDTGLLGEQMARLHRLAHRVVWVNPHSGKVGYHPVQQGIVAALPFCRRLRRGPLLATFARALEVVADA